MSDNTTHVPLETTDAALAARRISEMRTAYREAAAALDRARAELIAADREWQRVAGTEALLVGR